MQFVPRQLDKPPLSYGATFRNIEYPGVRAKIARAPDLMMSRLQCVRSSFEGRLPRVGRPRCAAGASNFRHCTAKPVKSITGPKRAELQSSLQVDRRSGICGSPHEVKESAPSERNPGWMGWTTSAYVISKSAKVTEHAEHASLAFHGLARRVEGAKVPIAITVLQC